MARTILKGESTLPIAPLDQFDLPESFNLIFTPFGFSPGNTRR